MADEPVLLIHEALKTDRVAVQIRDYCWREPVSDQSRCADHWFLDLSLTERPAASRGRYLDHWRGGRSEPIGDVLLLPHTLEFLGSRGAGRQTSLSLLLAPELFRLDADDLDEARLAAGLHVHDPDIRRALWRLAAEVRSPRVGSPAMIEAAAIGLAGLVERHLAGIVGDRPKRGGLSPRRRRLIDERISADLPPPGIGELARLCGLSERQLARAFREETGESLGGYVAAATLRRAWRLLAQTGDSISEIAQSLGYFSSASFGAAFRRSTGARPTDVRRPGGWVYT